jgi:glycosyltransferase involved in cell wall biosynthesis
LITDIYNQEKKVSIIIPTMNEAPNIRHVFPYIPQFVDEIIVIDANSTDGTIDEILKFRKDAKIIIEKSPAGKGHALKIGFENATGDLIIMMDADGSHDPKEIYKLIEPVLNGYDVSKGSRLLPGGGSDDFTLCRRFGNLMFVTIANALHGSHYTDMCYGYRAFKRDAIKKMCCKSNGFEIETEQSILMTKCGLKIKEVPSFEAERKHGKSNLRTFRDGWRIFSIIIKEYIKK